MLATDPSDYLGYSVSTAGDVNGDGYDDVLVGAYGKDGFKGAVYVIYGHPKFSSSYISLDLAALDPATTGFSITGGGSGDFFGYSVSTAGRVNDDEYEDLLIAAPAKDSAKGMVYVIYGGPTSSRTNIDLTTTTLDPMTTGFTIAGMANGKNFGYSLSLAGDVNKDGYDDVIVGTPLENSNQGIAYVIYGGMSSKMSNIDLATTMLDPMSTGFWIKGNSAGDYFGFSVGKAGDVNKDGYDDVIIGAPVKDSNQGTAYVVYGADKSGLANIDLSTTQLYASGRGFTMIGSDSTGKFGRAVGPAGDVNGDGYADIIVGAPTADGRKGIAYVIYGGEGMPNIPLATSPLDPGTTGFTITGETAQDLLGISVGLAGDVNGDGYSDLIIGASSKAGNTGAAYVIYGGPKGDRSDINLGIMALDPAGTGFTITGNTPGDQLGGSVGTAGDVNGDGYDDIVIGASSKDTNQGAAYVLYSSSFLLRIVFNFMN